jgi:hypothetical protein
LIVKDDFVKGAPVYGSSARGTWRERSITGNSESYVRHIKEGFGNEASFSLQRLREGNLDEGEASYNEDSKIHGMEGSGNGALLSYGSTMGT